MTPKSNSNMVTHKISLERFLKLTDVEMMSMKDGIWEIYDEKGNLNTVCTIIDGVENGVWNVFYENGKLEICGNYINGERDGVWKSYHRNGIPSGKTSYTYGRENGVWEFYFSDGSLKERYRYMNGKRVGELRKYYKNGLLKTWGKYFNGKETGEWKCYNKDGSIRMIIPYINGKVSRNYLNNDDGDNPKRTIHQMDNLLVEKIHIFLIQESIHWNEEKEGISFNEYIQISPLMNELMKRLSEWENKYGFCISTKFHLM